MKTLAIAIQKGGQGKTFATCHLAFDFAERGLRVLVVDLDTQENASQVLGAYDCGVAAIDLYMIEPEQIRKRFAGRDCNGISLVYASPELVALNAAKVEECGEILKANLAALDDLFDVCLIDTPPHLGNAMTSALISADCVLSPIELDSFSMEGMKKMVKLLGDVKEINRELEFIGMVPNRVNRNHRLQVENLKALQEAYPAAVVPFHISNRGSIPLALLQKIPVWKIRSTAARAASKEVRQMTEYVYHRMVGVAA